MDAERAPPKTNYPHICLGLVLPRIWSRLALLFFSFIAFSFGTCFCLASVCTLVMGGLYVGEGLAGGWVGGWVGWFDEWV